MIHDNLQVRQHVRDGLPRPAVDQVDVAPESDELTVLEHSQNVSQILLAPARRQKLRVELLDAHAHPRDARVAHGVKLRLGEKLSHALERDLGVRPESRTGPPYQLHEVPVLGRPIKVRGFPAEVERRHVPLGQPGLVEAAFPI